MISREAEEEIRSLAGQFKAVAVVGPRQSGKTTLTRAIFRDKPYTSLENPDTRQFAEQDPRGYLAQFTEGAVIDEAQRVPSLFSYLQQILDENENNGQFILSGSNNFLLQQTIAQSLAGRLAYAYLLPFSTTELKSGNYLLDSTDGVLFKGSYPPIYDRKIEPSKWYQNYIRTYVERDVRLVKNITNLSIFERFLRLCAGRAGQLLNKNNLSIEVGVDNKTIDSWLSVLESSFIIHLLKPHYQNFNKRVVKMPKLYFYDTGLLCSLLGIQAENHLISHPLKGNLFENFIVGEFLKAQFNLGNRDRLFFWRDSKGNEIDLILDKGNGLYPIEIKSGQTITESYFKGLNYWNTMTNSSGGTVIYAGADNQKRSNDIDVISYFKKDYKDFFKSA
ncbi:MAG: ATP-binding protein [Bacteroidota bacterium]